MTILALDFDGVMHTTTGSKFCRLELLEAWLRGRPGVRVLISSSWREVHPLDELVSFFSEDLQPRIAGVTPVYEKLYGKQWARSAEDIAATRYQRQVEIERWLSEHAEEDEQWAALDDDPSLFAPACKHLVVCDPRIGLTKRHLKQLDALLFDGVWDGGPSIKMRLAKIHNDVEEGRRTSESLLMLSRERVKTTVLHWPPEPPPLPYDWGEMEGRLELADMASIDEASSISGVPAAVLQRWAVSGRVLALAAAEPKLKFPRWALDEPLRSATPRLYRALGTREPWALLNWLETPLGSLANRTPRAAIEQGELERVLLLARHP